MSNTTASAIVTETVNNLMVVFAGQTVSYDAVGAQIETVYAAARKRCAFGSHMNVHNGIERRGARIVYSGPNYTGDMTVVFP